MGPLSPGGTRAAIPRRVPTSALSCPISGLLREPSAGETGMGRGSGDQGAYGKCLWQREGDCFIGSELGKPGTSGARLRFKSPIVLSDDNGTAGDSFPFAPRFRHGLGNAQSNLCCSRSLPETQLKSLPRALAPSPSPIPPNPRSCLAALASPAPWEAPFGVTLGQCGARGSGSLAPASHAPPKQCLQLAASCLFITSQRTTPH